jgi:hypothetical protein
MVQLVPQWSGPIFSQSVPWKDSFSGAPEDEEWVLSAMYGEAPAGHVVGGSDYNVWLISRARLVRELPEEAVQVRCWPAPAVLASTALLALDAQLAACLEHAIDRGQRTTAARHLLVPAG